MLGVLRHHTYRQLFAAQVLSLVGTGLTTVALALLAFQLAGANAGAVLGTALAIKMIAYVLISPIVGAYSASIDRRHFLIALDLVRALFVTLFPFVSEIWQVYVLVFAFQACSAAFTPTFQATIPDILTNEKDYTNALSLSRLAYDTEALVSPVIAALILGFVSFETLFIGTVFGFFASAALVLSTSLPNAMAADQSTTVLQRIGWGMRIFLRTPRLRGLLAVNFAVAAVGAFVIVNSVVLVRSVHDGSEAMLAKLMASYGLGSIIVALTLPKLLERHPIERHWMLAGGALLSLGLLLSLAASSISALLPTWALLGAANALALTPSGRLLRRSSTSADRPALFAAQFSLSHACWLVTYPLAGWLGARLGLTATTLVLASIACFALVVATLIWPTHDPEEIEHTHNASEHHHAGGHDNLHSPQPTDAEHHTHCAVTHRHPFVIDVHHSDWPKETRPG